MEKDNKMAGIKKCSIYVLGFVICIMPLLGCENGKEMSDPKASLERLAEEYWNKRLLDKDYKATYDMELEKGSLSFEEYLPRVHNLGQIQYVSIKVKEIKIDKDTGEVKLIVMSRIAPIPKDLELPLYDKWVIKSNQWKHILEKK